MTTERDRAKKIIKKNGFMITFPIVSKVDVIDETIYKFRLFGSRKDLLILRICLARMGRVV